jgi:hypothetical protein
MFGECITNVRNTVPLVHNITNYVTVNDVANVLYALKTAKAAGYTVFGVFDAHGESDQDGMRSAADVYVTRLADAAIISDTHWGCAR